MPLGLALITVKETPPSNKFKGFLDSSYPKEFNISRGLIQKIVNIITGTDSEDEGVLELKYNDKIILVNTKHIYGTNEIELIVLILAADETNTVKEFYGLLADQLESFYNRNKRDRALTFSEFAKLFYQQQASRKLLFIGFPSAGKTCIKKAFFDGVDPSILLGQAAPEPTRGLAHFVYSWLDAEVGIVDSSGQEFESYVSPQNSFERMIAFEESDIVIYIFDVKNWEEEREKVLGNLDSIINAKNSTAANATIYAFCHKIDLLAGTNQEKAKQFLEIKQILDNDYGIKTIFTSIQPELIHTLFRSMQIILNDLSKVGNSIEDFCNDVIKDQAKSAIFLLNDDNVVISQKATADMDLDDISHIINLVKNQQSILKETPGFGEMDYSVIHTKTNMALVVKAVNILKYGVSSVAFLSQNVTGKTLGELIEKLDKRLSFESRNSLAMDKNE
ncbi:hypothetical protein NEF87_000831 [Candidatus Lokiarchaeum ossiferum]|uniref:GTP-binding protein n=1 Tax=Candidatus Lokiarchaeum ossiferum TaxID=2951803 RepID=A0ABY6HM06_9ARCH|nr:hypothetical protein NEF87_000831 [Candidatus Lokiarchaeum sp. B-35]